MGGDLAGGAAAVPDGDTTPLAGNGTHFGAVDVGGSIEHTFALENSGLVAVNLTGAPVVQLGGSEAADFSVTSQPAAALAPWQAQTFVVRFTPGAAGLRRANLTIHTDDPDHLTYTFAIHGVGGPYQANDRHAAGLVLGQPDFTSANANSGANGMWAPMASPPARPW